MATNKISTHFTRPLPHFNVVSAPWEHDLAASLRAEFRAKIARRLPGHHMKGFKGGEIVATVARHKVDYPYFVRIDIAKFYPSIRHKDLLVGAQIAYRDLLSLDHVPNKFKQAYLGPLNRWCQSLPLRRGVPLGSPLSGLLAAVMLVPLWLSYKRHFEMPFIVFVDDVLFFAKTKEQCTAIYTFIENRLCDHYDLSINLQKSSSGRFSQSAIEFCGWRFAGGYATITQHKIDQFRQGLNGEIRRSLKCDARTLIKRINCKIDGFGNYYKHGDVVRQFDMLGEFVRAEMRVVLRSYGVLGGAGLEPLRRLGLHSLVCVREQLHSRKSNSSVRVHQPAPPRTLEIAAQKASAARVEQNLVTIDEKLTQLIALQRRLLHAVESMVTI